MLIIERRAGESILIGEEIEIRVLDGDGETVRLGVTTPRDFAVCAPETDSAGAAPDAASARDHDAGPGPE